MPATWLNDYGPSNLEALLALAAISALVAAGYLAAPAARAATRSAGWSRPWPRRRARANSFRAN